MFDVVVIGAGHAGVEAALAAARMGAKTLIFALQEEGVAYMACNPAIGGTAKGHIVREIDALGGEMALTADKALLQIKMLNRGKGPAVHSLRGQEDKKLYHDIMLGTLKKQKNLTYMVGEVVKILEESGKVVGVATKDGQQFSSKTVIVATGVYLDSRIITGEEAKDEGPSGLKNTKELSKSLEELGLPLRRFKTGTPARVQKDSLDYTKMQIQEGEDIDCFSFLTGERLENQQPCWLTYTNKDTHQIIKDNISRSPLYNGSIQGVGARYCPSIEDKVVRFAGKDRHQVFVEPEGMSTDEMYVQGMSSSLPKDVQEKMYRTLPGFENVKILKYAYAIEYDCIDTRMLHPTYQVKHIDGLYCAGQINGSSGYEEAAAQGLMAGINAVLHVQGKPPFILSRGQAYIGVLTDDLVTKGTNEPYRMMTARAEHRIVLRQDNADLRLTELGYQVGLASKERLQKTIKKKEEMARFQKIALKKPPKEVTDALFEKHTEELPSKTLTLEEIIKRPFVTFEDVQSFAAVSGFEEMAEISDAAAQSAVIEIKYAGYLKKAEAEISEQKRLENSLIPTGIDYASIGGLRTEARQKLAKVRPVSIGQAMRISGVSPADVTVLIVYLKTTKNGIC